MENNLFDKDYEIKDKAEGQFKIKSDAEMFKFLRQFIILTEIPCTPYKYKDGTYDKKAHYINGKRVNRKVYGYIKRWLKKQRI